MASFSSNSGGSTPPLNAIVADIGQYATKVGWAGDDQPKAYFRSSVAVRRSDDSSNGTNLSSAGSSKKKKKQSTTTSSSSTRSPIVDVRYDYYSRPIGGYNNNNSSKNPEDDSGRRLDGNWEIANPVDPVTGLWYQPATPTTTTATTTNMEELKQQSSSSSSQSKPTESSTTKTPNETLGEGADWADLLPIMLRHGYRKTSNLYSSSSSNSNDVDDTDSFRWDHPLILCERSYNPPPIRQQLLEIVMEELQVPAFFLAKDAVMQCYACGRTQGTVVDIGYSGTTVTPVYEGYVEPHGIQRAPIGLSHIDQRIVEYLDELYTKQQHQQQSQTTTASGSSNSGLLEFLPLYQVKQQPREVLHHSVTTPLRRAPAFHAAARLFVAQDCRLVGAGIAVDTTTDATTTDATTTSTNNNNNNNTATAANNNSSSTSSSSFQAPNKNYTLPDGTTVSLSSQFRFQSAHILLGRPQIIVASSDGGDGGGTTTVNANPIGVPATTTATTAAAAIPSLPEQEMRQWYYEKNKQDWMTYIQQQEQILEASDNDPKNNNNSNNHHAHHKDDDGDDTMDHDFSDSAAVGIAKRRTKRQKVLNNKDSTTTTGPTTRSTPPPPSSSSLSATRRRRNKSLFFSNTRLNGACHKYFSTFLHDPSSSSSLLSSCPIAQMICESAYHCDRDQLPTLLGTVILGGGGACLGPTEQAVPDLLKEQTERLIQTHTPGWRVKMVTPPVAERAILPWLGASILGSLGTFHEMYVTKAEYEEWGSAIINRKCP